MKNNIFSGLIVAFIAAALPSCGNDAALPEPDSRKDSLEMTFAFSHPDQTKASETAFEPGDKVGLFLSDAAATLEIAGNTLNNEPLTLGGSGWSFSRKLFWDNGTFNAYGYYPFQDDIPSITDLPFAVRPDQDKAASGNALSGYEASDFLYADAKGVTASADPVNMKFRHIMSKISIRIIKGEDFEGDLPDDATVYLHNTVTEATIDLSAGVATKQPKASARTITALHAGNNTYSAIVVPQRLDNRVPLIEVVMKGVSYLYESKFLFKQGTHHLVNLVVDKNPEQVKIEIGGEITNWN